MLAGAPPSPAAQKMDAPSSASGRKEFRITAAVLIAACIVAWFAGTSFHLYVVNLILLSCIGALGLNLLMGTAGQVSIGNAAFLTSGAFSAVVFSQFGMPLVVCLVMAMIVSAFFGLVVGLPALRIKGIYLILSTMAAHYLALFVAEKYQTVRVGSAGFTLDPVFSGSLLAVQRSWLIALLFVVLVVMLIVGRLEAGRLGRAWRMIRDREDAAPAMGIPTARYKLGAFVLSSAIIGLQGGLMGYFTGGVSNESFSLHVAIAAIAMILIGGMGRISGSILGAAIVTALPFVTPPLVNALLGNVMATQHASQVSLILYGMLIIVFISYAREGVRGWIVHLAHRVSSRRT